MGDEDPTTQEMRLEMVERERTSRAAADDTPVPLEARQHERRSERAAYLREKLEERAAAERAAG